MARSRGPCELNGPLQLQKVAGMTIAVLRLHARLQAYWRKPGAFALMVQAPVEPTQHVSGEQNEQVTFYLTGQRCDGDARGWQRNARCRQQLERRSKLERWHS